MAHTGTIDLGRQARPASGPNRWLALVAIAAVAVIYLAVAYGLTGGNLAATPSADRSYDQVEAQRGATTLVSDDSYDTIEKLRALGVVPPAAVNSTEMTSGTFHAGTPAAPAPVKRDRIGGQ
jgi:hypothetical protein